MVVSFTEQDDAIAKAMARALQKKGLNVFYYKDHNNWGKSLDEITAVVYEQQALTGLVILSNWYPTKKICLEEWSYFIKAKRSGKLKRLFVLRLDAEAKLPNLKSKDIYGSWNDNPHELAEKIHHHVKRLGGGGASTLAWLVLFLVLTIAALLWFSL